MRDWLATSHTSLNTIDKGSGFIGETERFASLFSSQAD